MINNIFDRMDGITEIVIELIRIMLEVFLTLLLLLSFPLWIIPYVLMKKRKR